MIWVKGIYGQNREVWPPRITIPKSVWPKIEKWQSYGVIVPNFYTPGPFFGGTMIVGSSRTVNKNCSLHRVYIIGFLSFGWKMKIGQVIASSSLIVRHRPSSSVIVPRHRVDPFFSGRWRTMIVGSSWTLNKNCSLHRVYIMNFFAVGWKVNNGQDFGLIVPHNSYTYGGPFFFGTMTDDDCWIKSDSKQKLFLT